MRKGSALALLVFAASGAGALKAQEAIDSLADMEAADSADRTVRRVRESVDSGPNPYLREVRTKRGENKWWASLAAGAGSEGFRLSFPGAIYTPARAGFTLALDAGVKVTRHLGFGAEVFSWFGDGERNTIDEFRTVLLQARVYPAGGHGPFIKAGGGVGVYGVYDLDYDEYAWTDAGFGYMLGAGWEIPVDRNLSLSPLFEYHSAGLAGGHERVFNFGFMMTWATAPALYDEILDTIFAWE